MRRVMGILATAVIAAGAWSVEEKASDEPLPEEAYTQPRDCIFRARIFDTDVLSDRRILFRMNDKQRYLVQLPARCPGLRRHAKVMYVSDDLRLCEDDYLRPVLEYALDKWEPGMRCKMGAFEPITEAQYQELIAEHRPPDAPSVWDLIFGRRGAK